MNMANPAILSGHHQKRAVPVIGLLGGIASGKTLVAKCLEELGAGVLNADRVGHEVLLEDEVKRAARQRWGDGIFAADAQIDRKALAKIVFDPSPKGREELQYLEELTHPRIGQRLSQEAQELAASGRYPALVLDAPVMLEAGWQTLCDHIVFVDAPRPARLGRALARGWTEADFTSREAAQESLDVKLRHADAIIDNSGSAESTQAQVRRLWHSLIG
jgi:dephospho-CoA kinase